MIKKTFRLTAMLLLVLVSAGKQLNAQSNDDFNEKATFGIKGGINNSNVYDEKGDNFVADSKLGFVAGGFIGIPLGNFLGLQPEVLYAQKGYQSSGKILLQDYSFTRTTNHLDIPIQLQIKPVPAITLLAGLQFSYLLSSKDKLKVNNSTSINEKDFDNDNPRKNTLGFVGGVDVNISRLVISGRAGWDFQDNKGDGTSTSPRYKNRWVQFTAGVRF